MTVNGTPTCTYVYRCTHKSLIQIKEWEHRYCTLIEELVVLFMFKDFCVGINYQTSSEALGDISQPTLNLFHIEITICFDKCHEIM